MKTHNLSSHPLFRVWINIKRRCDDKNAPYHKNYGGRGIILHKEWYDFKTFYDWSIENEWKKGLSIDRINNDGNYEPSNCRWTTRATQQRNTRKLCKNNTSGYRGVSWDKSMSKWASYVTLNYKKVHLGYFKCRIAAAYAYDNYVIENKLEHTRNF